MHRRVESGECRVHMQYATRHNYSIFQALFAPALMTLFATPNMSRAQRTTQEQTQYLTRFATAFFFSYLKVFARVF